MGPDGTIRRCDRKVLLRIPKRHEIRGPASLLVGTEAEFNRVGLFSTHECAPALRAHAAQTGTCTGGRAPSSRMQGQPLGVYALLLCSRHATSAFALRLHGFARSTRVAQAAQSCSLPVTMALVFQYEVT